MGNLVKTTLVVVGSTVLATLAVNAVDMKGYFSSTMLGAVFQGIEENTSECPQHMVLVTQALTPFCIDAYEASAGESCMYSNPQREDETVLNLADSDCDAVSLPYQTPWRHISLDQAQQACARSGKRLPTANEWYKAALGTPDSTKGFTDEHCNVANNRADGVSETGSGIRCVSDAGAYDMIGNVWEWVHELVHYGNWNNQMLPETGFVSGVDLAGIAYETNTGAQERFMHDRFWSDVQIVAGMMRGGYYNNGGQAGIFATYTASPPTFAGEAVGFRCVSTKQE
jgi:formylglycine-generating enzyme required for sulfatase activity